MIGRKNGTELVFHEGHCLDFSMFRLIFNKPQIYGVVQHMLLDEAGIIYHSLYPERRKGFLITFDQGGKDMSADGDAGADTDGAQSIPVLDLFFHIFKKRNNVQGIAVKFTSGLSRTDAPADPIKKPYAVVFFQFFYSQAYRRLGQMQFFGSSCNIAVAIDRYKYFHMAKGHRVLLLYNKNIMIKIE